MKLPLLPQDKANHALYGALAFLITSAAMRATPWPDMAAVAGVCGAVLAGLAKEARDAWANRQAEAWHLPLPHEVSGGDVLATGAGGVLCYVAAALAG